MTPSFPSISTHSRPLYRLSLRINPCDTPSVMFITSRLSLHSPSTTPIQRHPMTSAYFTHSFSDPTNGHPDLRFFHLHPLHIVSFPRCKNTLLHLKPTALYSFTLFALHCINRHSFPVLLQYHSVYLPRSLHSVAIVASLLLSCFQFLQVLHTTQPKLYSTCMQISRLIQPF